MHDSYMGCVSEALAAEENPAAYVIITPSLPLLYEKQSESNPLNTPPTQSLSAGFSDTLLVGNRGAGVRGTLTWYSRDPRVQD